MKGKVEEFFLNILPEKMPGYEARHVQLEMAIGIAEAFTSAHKAIIEAGTGTGKSLAYLVPSFFTDKDSRVAISTGTKNLQEQLFKKDLPFLARIWQEVYGEEISFMYVQGRSNYICLTRLRNTLIPEDDRALLSKWIKETEDGNINELTGRLHPETVRNIVSDPDYCLSQKCPFRTDCFITRLRVKAQRTKILVVNHHLLLTDLMIKDSVGADQNSILPALSHIVLDEAHHLEKAATECFGEEVSFDALHGLRNQVINNRELQRQDIELKTRIEQELWDAVPHINRAKELGETMDREDTAWGMQTDAALVAGNIRQHYREAAQLLAEYGDTSVEAEALSRKVNRVVRSLDAFLDDKNDRVSWLDRQGFHSVLLSVREALRRILFSAVEPVALTSATLSTSGNFRYIKSRLGLDSGFTPRELILPSLFDYSKVLLAIPTDHLNPNSEKDIERIADHLREIVPRIKGGSFILCTSFKMVRIVKEKLQDLEGINLYVHGDKNAQELIASFRADGRGVLIGVDSFWEGVDVPGDALKAVFITKLPFPVPSEPLFAARQRLVEERGGNSFRELSLPAALLKLRQGFGRLIRRQSDEGLVVIYDSRALYRSYSRDVFQSLPKCREWRGKLDEMAAFIENDNYLRTTLFQDS